MNNQELLTLTNNVQSLIEQIKQVATGGNQAVTKNDDKVENMDELEKIKKFLKEIEEEEPTGDEVPMDTAPAEVEEEEEIEMSDDEDADDVMKSANGATASDDAEDRIEDMDEVNEDNIKEVAKALVRLMAKKSAKSTKSSSVVKSNKISIDNRVLKSIINRIEEQDKALASILEGFGIADQVKKSIAPVRTDAMTVQKSMDLFKDEIRQLIQTSQSPSSNDGAKTHVVAKSLADNDGLALKSIFANAFRNSQK